MALGDPNLFDSVPKYALVELERRWLVDPETRPSLAGMEFTAIEDRYLEGTRFRLRRMTNPDGSCDLKFAKKYESEDPSARPMVNAYLTEAEHAAFASLPACCVNKKRYHLHQGGLEFSIDVFEDDLSGLEILEVETSDKRALDAVVPPDWAGKEITHMPRWQGGTLARTQTIPE